MKWTYCIPNKMGTSILLMGALVLVLVNNLKERANSKQLKTAFESIYEDRLMAETYLFRLTHELHQIEELLKSPKPGQKEKLFEKIDEIEQINLLYLETKLTAIEDQRFEHFEKQTWDLTRALQSQSFEIAQSKIKEALRDLQLLSDIQVLEAQGLLAQTQRIFSSGSLSSQFEIGLVIVLGLMIQSILFASKTLQERKSFSPENLN
ncbi:hypothetical protein [Algoriphagus sp. A40]|uniref:hypothetical protein n=1 Tax=Algoriphagus sp. A40 TaxID=1945863 RepID=UPI00098471EE|nr:hypothetical protein [Algoriphagus sp. A40]OOG77497.1 hypothetical protein B0E43_05195 [Algoriphagus sp. A40]